MKRNPSNKKKRIYSIFLRSLAILTALLATPEAFARAVEVLGHPLLRHLMRVLRLGIRLALAVALFLNGGVHFLDLYKLLMVYLRPILDQTVNVLAGPNNFPLSVLFVEKLIKVLFSSLISSYLAVCLKNTIKSKEKRFLYFLVLICLGCLLYWILLDFVY